MKKSEIENTKPTLIISTFKTDIIKVGSVFSISKFFITKTSLANKWRSAVEHPLCDVWMEKTQILIAHQKKGVDLDKKSTARD